MNIAARVEALGEAGGVCITRSVFDQVKNQLTQLNFDYIGECAVKNILEPVRVYRVLTDSVSVPIAERAAIEPCPRQAAGNALPVAD